MTPVQTPILEENDPMGRDAHSVHSMIFKPVIVTESGYEAEKESGSIRRGSRAEGSGSRFGALRKRFSLPRLRIPKLRLEKASAAPIEYTSLLKPLPETSPNATVRGPRVSPSSRPSAIDAIKEGSSIRLSHPLAASAPNTLAPPSIRRAHPPNTDNEGTIKPRRKSSLTAATRESDQSEALGEPTVRRKRPSLTIRLPWTKPEEASPSKSSMEVESDGEEVVLGKVSPGIGLPCNHLVHSGDEEAIVPTPPQPHQTAPTAPAFSNGSMESLSLSCQAPLIPVPIETEFLPIAHHEPCPYSPIMLPSDSEPPPLKRIGPVVMDDDPPSPLDLGVPLSLPSLLDEYRIDHPIHGDDNDRERGSPDSTTALLESFSPVSRSNSVYASNGCQQGYQRSFPRG